MSAEYFRDPITGEYQVLSPIVAKIPKEFKDKISEHSQTIADLNNKSVIVSQEQPTEGDHVIWINPYEDSEAATAAEIIMSDEDDTSVATRIKELENSIGQKANDWIKVIEVEPEAGTAQTTIHIPEYDKYYEMRVVVQTDLPSGKLVALAFYDANNIRLMSTSSSASISGNVMFIEGLENIVFNKRLLTQHFASSSNGTVIEVKTANNYIVLSDESAERVEVKVETGFAGNAKVSIYAKTR